MEVVMKFSGWILSVATGAVFLSIGAVSAEESSPLPKGFSATPVLKSGKTADGDPLAYPQTQKPEVVSVIGTLEPKGQTALHRHPVPVFVYILEGQLAVQPEGKERRNYKAGEAFLETVNMWHQAFNEGDQPTKLLVVFLGEEGKPTTEAKQ
jgi:quercetin dioxygenase-like cupin family protein